MVQRASLTKGSSMQVTIRVSIICSPSAHAGSSSSYDSGFPTGDHELFTTFSWDDQKVRRVFIRKVIASPQLSRTGELVRGSPSKSPWSTFRPAETTISPSLVMPADSSCWEMLPLVSPHCHLLFLNTRVLSLLSRDCGAPLPMGMGSETSLSPFTLAWICSPDPQEGGWRAQEAALESRQLQGN